MMANRNAWRGLTRALFGLCMSCAATWTPAQAPAAAEASAPLPLEAFFGPARLQGASLSPDGRWLAAITGAPGRRVGLQIIDLESAEAPRFIEASATDDVNWFQWVNDDWLVFSVHDAQPRRYIYKGPGLMSVRRDGSDSRQLVGRTLRSANATYMGRGAPGSTDVIVAYSQSSLYAIDVATGKSRRHAEDSPRAGWWWLDAQGRARVASRRDGDSYVLWWADTAGRWREISRQPLLDGSFEPAFVEGDDTLVVDTVDAAGYLELRRFDFTTGRPQAGEPILRTPGFSSDVRVHRRRGSGQIDGYSLELDARAAVWLDPRMRDLQERVDTRFPGRVNVIQARPEEQPRAVLVESRTDADPGQVLVYRPQQDRWMLLGAVRPDLDPVRMGSMSFHRIKARDGRDLPLWITRPAGHGKQPAPAVVLVHGGPHLRGSTWGWHAQAQFLASRGYVVVQPECIMGSSYGGYATLMGLAKDPDQYRCGVAFAALSDPRHQYDFHWSDLSDAARRYLLPVMLGDPKLDADILAAGSPLAQVQRIKAPLLLAHGDDDVRVPLENGERMRDALIKLGKPVEWVLYVDEGHGLVQEKNRYDWYRRVEAFLATHLKASTPAPSHGSPGSAGSAASAASAAAVRP